MSPHRKIVRSVLRRHRIGPKDLFSASRLSHLVAARFDAAAALAEHGYHVAQIARFLKKNDGTIHYYLKPDMRAQKRQRYLSSRAEGRA
jgi:ParB-like chromosome segregation protein Spo0J